MCRRMWTLSATRHRHRAARADAAGAQCEGLQLPLLLVRACKLERFICRSAAAASATPMYVWGDAGSNACPDGSTRITDQDQCEAAGPVMGEEWSSSLTAESDPKGCYKDSQKVYFNRHDTGGTACADCKLLCKAAAVTATPAPTSMYARACVRRIMHAVGSRARMHRHAR